MGKRNKGSQAMRLYKKQQEQKEKEMQNKAQTHVDNYTKLTDERKQRLDARVSVTDRGLTAYLVVIDGETGKDLKEKDQKAFQEEYKKITKEDGIEFFAELAYNPRGITPRLRLREYREPQVMNWPEAQRQNLETRIECSHDLSDNADACKLCGLEKENWGADAKGVTPEYEKRKRKEIEEALKKMEAKEQK